MCPARLLLLSQSHRANCPLAHSHSFVLSALLGDGVEDKPHHMGEHTGDGSDEDEDEDEEEEAEKEEEEEEPEPGADDDEEQAKIRASAIKVVEGTSAEELTIKKVDLTFS